MTSQAFQESRWIGRVLRDKWRIDRKIARGGMGIVFAATHKNNGRAAAIKVLYPQFSNDSDTRGRFLQEGYAANKVDHPGVVRILDDDVSEEGLAYLVMELLEGELLEQRRIRSGGILPLGDVYDVADQLLDVLAAAHGKGIVHRDVKPDNIFLVQRPNTSGIGRLKVLDFGFAQIKSVQREQTATGYLLGTPGFMSPEQAAGKRALVDAQTDIWAVGATLYLLLTGHPVHAGENAAEMLIAAANVAVRPIGLVEPRLPTKLGKAIDRALAFEKKERWPDARSMQEALRAVPGRPKGLGAPPVVDDEMPVSSSEEATVMKGLPVPGPELLRRLAHPADGEAATTFRHPADREPVTVYRHPAEQEPATTLQHPADHEGQTRMLPPGAAAAAAAAAAGDASTAMTAPPVARNRPDISAAITRAAPGFDFARTIPKGREPSPSQLTTVAREVPPVQTPRGGVPSLHEDVAAGDDRTIALSTSGSRPVATMPGPIHAGPAPAVPSMMSHMSQIPTEGTLVMEAPHHVRNPAAGPPSPSAFPQSPGFNATLPVGRQQGPSVAPPLSPLGVPRPILDDPSNLRPGELSKPGSYRPVDSRTPRSHPSGLRPMAMPMSSTDVDEEAGPHTLSRVLVFILIALITAVVVILVGLLVILGTE